MCSGLKFRFLRTIDCANDPCFLIQLALADASRNRGDFFCFKRSPKMTPKESTRNAGSAIRPWQGFTAGNETVLSSALFNNRATYVQTLQVGARK